MLVAVRCFDLFDREMTNGMSLRTAILAGLCCENSKRLGCHFNPFLKTAPLTVLRRECPILEVVFRRGLVGKISGVGPGKQIPGI